MSGEIVTVSPDLMAQKETAKHLVYRPTKGGGHELVKSTVNLAAILSYDPRWQDDARIHYDVFGQRTRCKDPPWHPDDAPATPSDEWTDDDTTRLDLWLRRHWDLDLPTDKLRAIVNVVAHRNEVDPRRDWLDGLVWDGTSRLANWLEDYAGVKPSPYVKSVGPKWMLSAVVRAFEPGCKVDTLVVLEGAQGMGKSTLLRTLVPVQSWFSDTPIDLMSKDAYVALQGKWIIELPELASLKKADLDRMKAFFSSASDSYRPPYGREQITVPRTVVFAGTVNHGEYLNDATGARRFWPVKVGRIDLAKLNADRDQLWAETVAIYKDWVSRGRPADEPLWWPSREELRAFEVEQADRQVEDVWTPTISRWLESEQARAFIAKHGGVTTHEVIAHAIGLDVKQSDNSHLKKAASVLTTLQWIQVKRITVNGSKRRIWASPAIQVTGTNPDSGPPSGPQFPMPYQ